MDDLGRVEAQLTATLSPSAYVQRETLDRVRHFLQRPRNSAYTDLKGMCERVSDSYRNRVVLELLQNAHDAHERDLSDGRIRIILDPDDGLFGTLCVANDGRGFTTENFDGLSSPSRTTKPVGEAIGNKGVGFLSVFQVSAHPEVYSRATPGNGLDGFCFRFADDEAVGRFLASDGLADAAETVLAGMPRLYLACPTEEIPSDVAILAADGFATIIRLPLKSTEARAAVAEQLDQLLAGPPVQLFLTRIAELSVENRGDGKPPVLLSRESEIVHNATDLRLMRVRCGADRFIVAQTALPEARVAAIIAADVAAERLPEAWLDWRGEAVISLAVAETGPPLGGRLYNFLPMGAETAAPLAGHLDAPFCATINRLQLQPGVELNSLFWNTARTLAVKAARAVRTHLPAVEARQAALDLVLWRGKDRDGLLTLLSIEGETPVPVLRRGAVAWARIDRMRIWKGDELLTPQAMARVSDLALVDPAVGAERVSALAAFLADRHTTACTPAERAGAAEAFAVDMHRRRLPASRWDAFYGSLARLFRTEASELTGRRLLLTARGDLALTAGGVEARPGRGKRRPRLSSVFLPPLRGVNGIAPVAPELPLAVQRRIDYLDARLEIARDGANAARRFLVAGGLVRAAAMHSPGDVKDPEGLRWDALTAMMRIVKAEDTADGAVLELLILVPTREGWSRANLAYFSARWGSEAITGLQRLLDEAAGLSAELDAHAARLLRSFQDWPVKDRDRDAWRTFLRKAGVVDHLRPVPAFSGPAPRELGGSLIDALVNRSNLPVAHREAWRRLMAAQTPLQNQFTPYTAAEVFRLPGQLDHSALAPVVGRLYALEVIRTLEARPGLPRISVFRPLHSGAPNRASWPSPVAAFLDEAVWIPLSAGGLGRTARTWLPGHAAAPPPRLAVADHAVVSALPRHPEATDVLRGAGLKVYGDRDHAWRFLEVAGEIVGGGLPPAEAERMLSAAREAWIQVRLDSSPAGLALIGRRHGTIVATVMSGDGPSVLVADGDDRQTIGASVRGDPDQIVFEPPRTRAGDIGAFLRRTYPQRVTRSADIPVVYESADQALVFSSEVPFVEDELGGGLRDVLILGLRYRNSFYHGDVDDVLQRLATVRLRWIDRLQMRVGAVVAEVPRFAERAVLLSAPEGSTILAASALKGTERVLVAIAEALGAALGNRRQIGEPLQLFAAQLRPDPLACTETDYAEVLEATIEEIRGVLGSARAALAALLRTLRPFAVLYGDEGTGRAFAPGGGLGSEDDVLQALTALGAALPVPPAEMLQRGRQGDVRAVAIGIGVDLAALNAVLATMGSPYGPVDLTELHRDALSTFLTRREASVRESIRLAFRGTFEAGGDLSAYVTARDAPRPAMPDGFGLTSITLPQTLMTGWLASWLAARGVNTLVEPPRDRDSMEAVREINMRRLRTLARSVRVAILRHGEADEPLKTTFATLAATETALTAAAARAGWGDFDLLDEGAALAWLARSGLWPKAWPTSITMLSLGEADFAEVARQDEQTRIAAVTKRRVIDYSGGTFTVGVDSLGSLADRIAGLVATNSGLLATPHRTVRGVAPIIRPRGPRGPSDTGPPGPPPGSRLSDEERDVIGFFGEAIAFDWLKQRFGRNRVVDLSCWKSGYRRHVDSEPGNDSLGYDFAVGNGGTTWYFEVKATKADEVQPRHMVELGSSEIAQAEVCRADKRSRFRILYVLDALHPDKAKLFVLPNPRSREGEAFYAEPSTAGVRLLFPLRN
jgi:hypothetical protein